MPLLVNINVSLFDATTLIKRVNNNETKRKGKSTSIKVNLYILMFARLFSSLVLQERSRDFNRVQAEANRKLKHLFGFEMVDLGPKEKPSLDSNKSKNPVS